MTFIVPTGDDLVLDHHRVVRDGSVWLCSRCRRTWPWPTPVPADVEPCQRRTWGEQ